MTPQEKFIVVCNAVEWEFWCGGIPLSCRVSGERDNYCALTPDSVDDLLHVCEFGDINIKLEREGERSWFAVVAETDRDKNQRWFGREMPVEAILDAMYEATCGGEE